MRFALFISLLGFVLNTIAQTDNQPKNGYIKKKDASNKLIYEGEFKNDVPIGVFKYYYPNDSVKAIMKFKNEGKIAYAKLFHPNGKRMAEGKYIKREIKDSTWTYFDEAGVLISRDNYKAGKKDGACFVYFPDGKISEERNYKEDKLNGEFKDYFSEQLIRAKGAYVNGQMEGRVVYYYPNGVEVAAGYYKNGSKNGPWVYRTESNKVREKELYKNGQLASQKETEAFFAKNKVAETVKPQNNAGNKKSGKPATINPNKK